MTTTREWLTDAPGGKLAIVATIEGIKYALALAKGFALTSLRTMYQSDGYADLLPGLHLVGQVSQGIELFEAVATESSLEIAFTDDSAFTMAALLAASESGAKTSLSDQHFATGGTVNTDDDPSAKGFAAAGAACLGRETFTYTGTSAAAPKGFTGCTRGVYSDGRTSAGGRIGRPHRFSVEGDVTGALVSTVVAATPQVVINRIVTVYGHHVEDGAPVAIADRAVIYRGLLTQVVRRASGELRFAVAPLQKVLDQQILSEQFVGEPVAQFIVSADAPQKIRVGVMNTGADYGDTVAVDNGTYNGWQDLLAAVGRALSGASTGGTNHIWNAHQWSAADGVRAALFVADTAGADLAAGLYWFSMSDELSRFLGFEPAPWTEMARQDFMAQTVAEHPAAQWAACLYDVTTGTGQIKVRHLRGTLIAQPRTLPGVAATVLQFIQIGSMVLGVSGSSLIDGVYTFAIRGYVDREHGWLPAWQIPYDDRFLRGYEGDRRPEVKQVWIEQGDIGDILLRTLASVDGAGDNHATYDDRHASMGAQLPWNYLDEASFVTPVASIVLQIDRPASIRASFEKALAACGRYLLAVNGQFKLIPLPWESAFTSVKTIDHGDYCGDEYPDLAIGGLPVVNRLTLKAGLRPFSTPTDVTVQDVCSMSDYGPAVAPSFDAPGLVDIDAWARNVIGPALKYLSRNPHEIRLQIGWPCSTLAPGDGVTITDPSLLDPATAARGIANMPAAVLSHRFDFATGKGEATLLFLPGAQRSAIWAPSARITAYDAGTKTITVEAHRYSASDDGTDISELAAGDKVIITTIDASAAAVHEHCTLASVDPATHTAVLTAALSTWNGARTWDLVAEVIADAVPRQTARFGYHSDGSDRGDGSAPNIWVPSQRPTTGGPITPEGMADLSAIAAVKGSPAAVSLYHHAAMALDQIARDRGRQVLVSESYATPVSSPAGVTETEWHLLHVPIPLEYPSALESWRRFYVEIGARIDEGGGLWHIRPVFCTAVANGPGYQIGQWGNLGTVCYPAADLAISSETYMVATGDVVPPAMRRAWYLQLLARRIDGVGPIVLRDISVYGA